MYDGANPYADFDGSDNLTQRYLYGPAPVCVRRTARVDMIMARLSAQSGIAWYLTDHLGSVRDMADTAGTVIDHIQYDSFGNVLWETNREAGDRFKFTGREYDAETGLYYYRARYYDPTVGRFIMEDPLRFGAGEPNLYRYVFNSPTNYVDPTGCAGQDREDRDSGGWRDLLDWIPLLGGAIRELLDASDAFDQAVDDGQRRRLGMLGFSQPDGDRRVPMDDLRGIGESGARSVGHVANFGLEWWEQGSGAVSSD